MWSDRCAVHEYKVLQMSLHFLCITQTKLTGHTDFERLQIQEKLLRIPFFLYVSLFQVPPAYRRPGRDLNRDFAQPDSLQGLMAFTHSASLPGSCYTVVRIQTLQEL